MSSAPKRLGLSDKPQAAATLDLSRSYRRFVFPTLAVLAVLTLVPILMTLTLSFTSLSFTSIAPTRFVGFQNYLRLFGDPRFLTSLTTSVIFIVVPVALQLVFGFVLAVVMVQKLPGLGWLRFIFVAPMVLPPIIMGLMWKVLFTPQLGGVNYFLSLINVTGPDWLVEPRWAVTAIVIAALWGWTPFVALMFLASMETFSTELYDAAAIDGATWRQAVQHIMLPQLRPTITVVAVFRVIEALAIFPIIFVLTGGGPANSTETVNYYAYVSGFDFLKLAYASAIIFVFFVALIALITPALWSIAGSVEES